MAALVLVKPTGMMWINWSQQDDVIRWKHFLRYWLLVRGIHRSPVNSPHKGQWCGGVFFDLRLNKRLSKQSWGWWFDTLLRPLWRHCNELTLKKAKYTVHPCVCSVGYIHYASKELMHGMRNHRKIMVMRLNLISNTLRVQQKAQYFPDAILREFLK